MNTGPRSPQADAVRIGLHCTLSVVGQCWVSSARLELYRDGDGVHVASRIEGLNSIRHLDLAFPENVVDQCRTLIVARPPGLGRPVKGPQDRKSWSMNCLWASRAATTLTCSFHRAVEIG